MDPDLRQALDRVPELPGCYLYKDGKGTVLYVGKAVNLRRRVFQYFQERADLGPKNRLLVEQIRSLETLVVGGELEALVLEENLIKRFRPRFNVLLRDDKRYPYLQVTLSEAYPRLLVTRRPHLAKDRYYGPFVHVGAMRQVLRLVHRHLGLRQCSIEIDRSLPRPCLYYDLHQCNAPCVAWGEDRAAYAEHVRQVQLLLEGREDGLVEELRARMEAAAAAERYEEAARLRDGLRAIELVRARQRVVLPEPRDVDVVALARLDDSAGVKVFFVRGGKLVDWQDCRLANAESTEPAEILSAFVKQFYSGAAAVPPEVLLSDAVADAPDLEAWLASRRGARVDLTAPRRGDKAALVRLCEANALEMLREEGTEARRFGERRPGPDAPRAAAADVEAALAELQERLGLAGPPRRMDCFDISHFQGSHTVASMVVMRDGLPDKGEYRRFRIRTVSGVDDFASMEEVVTRRYRRVRDEGGPWPDLIVIDGGKGQLSAALKALRALDLGELPVVGLAKRFEEIFVPGRLESLRLDERSPGRLLVQRLRDEAHRFAITFHRGLRAKALTHSALEDVEGVGPALKRRLLRAFGSAEAVFAASLEELCAVEGVGPRLARRLKAGPPTVSEGGAGGGA